MIKKNIIIFFLLYGVIDGSYAQNVIAEYDIFLKSIDFETIILGNLPYTYMGDYDKTGHFFMRTSNSNMFVTSFLIFADGNVFSTWLETSAYVEFSIDLEDKHLHTIETDRGKLSVSNLVHDSSSVIVDDRRVYLEQSYDTFMIENLDGESYYHELRLEQAIISKNKKWIGGVVQRSQINSLFHTYFYAYNINIWDSTNGKLQFSENPYIHISTSTQTIELRFILNDYFFLIRTIPFFNDVKASFPCTYLLDLETYEFIPVNRDLALTSDEKYYVTERDGLPSLVETATHEVIQRYDPGSPMTACCFSPDDHTLYIACEDLQIYAFDSHLPSVVIEWELY